jgi:RNA polymerase sigma-70 factor (ECF subfamily)
MSEAEVSLLAAGAAGAIRAVAPSGALAVGESGRRLRDLVVVYQDFVWRSLRRLGVPPAQVDDATQEVFLVAARRLDDIETSRERSFLFGVTMRVASDARRARARARERADQAAVDGAIATSPTPEGSVGEQQDRALLDMALDALDDEARAVFVLFEIEGLTSPQIASLLGIALGTVASRLRRGREQFHAAAARLRARLARGGRR